MDEAQERKATPICTGVLDFFPDAIAEIARVSFAATQQHHPGEPMHWDKSKSTDEADALARHLLKRGTRDTDGQRHSAKVAWRGLALLQRELDAEALDEATPGWANRHPGAFVPDDSDLTVSHVFETEAAAAGVRVVNDPPFQGEFGNIETDPEVYTTYQDGYEKHLEADRG